LKQNKVFLSNVKVYLETSVSRPSLYHFVDFEHLQPLGKDFLYALSKLVSPLSQSLLEGLVEQTMQSKPLTSKKIIIACFTTIS